MSDKDKKYNPVHLVFAQPEESDELLINPMMGFETYQRFNGDETTKTNYWPTEGPTEFAETPDDLSNTDHPDTSVAYLRWNWARLEPEQGGYRWDIIEEALEEAEKRGQELHLRVMPHDETGIIPEWYKQEAKVIEFNLPSEKRSVDFKPEVGKSCIPDYTDPLFQESIERFVFAMGERYDDDPRLCAVDIGTLGQWGEWHNSLVPGNPFMDEEGVRWAVNIYFEAFPNTPLIMLLNHEYGLSYACRKGGGWRADCWGDLRDSLPGAMASLEGMGQGWNHMKTKYPVNLFRADAGDAWRKGPVSLETCWTFVYWYEMGWDIDYILDEALRWHATLINAKSSIIPEEWQDKVEEFQKKLGYRFVLRQVRYPAEVKTGESFSFDHWWVNRGVAPCYQDYRIKVRLKGPGGEIESVLNHDMRQIMPGVDFCPADAIAIPAGVEKGNYKVQFGIVRRGKEEPSVKMANKGRNGGNWLSVGVVELI